MTVFLVFVLNFLLRCTTKGQNSIKKVASLPTISNIQTIEQFFSYQIIFSRISANSSRTNYFTVRCYSYKVKGLGKFVQKFDSLTNKSF